MRRVERGADLGDDARDARQVHGAAVDDLAQVRAGHEAHGEIQPAVGFAAAVDRHDVRVLDRGRQPALGLEARHGGRVLRVLRRDDLQRDLTVEIGVDGPVDDAHAAPLEHALDAVPGEERAGFEVCGGALRDFGQDGHLRWLRCPRAAWLTGGRPGTGSGTARRQLADRRSAWAARKREACARPAVSPSPRAAAGRRRARVLVAAEEHVDKLARLDQRPAISLRCSLPARAHRCGGPAAAGLLPDRPHVAVALQRAQAGTGARGRRG